jgi:hypothetical protein
MYKTFNVKIGRKSGSKAKNNENERTVKMYTDQ